MNDGPQEFQDKTNVKDWPIEPRFLSIRAGANRFDNNYSPNIDGLFDANELRGILADASATLWEADGIEYIDIIGTGQNFALFQIVPETYNAMGVGKWEWFTEIEKEYAENSIIRNILDDRKILRIYSRNMYPTMDCCKLFRNCKYEDETGKEFNFKNKCSESDSRIALLYHKELQTIPKNSNSEYDWDKFYDRLNKIMEEYNEIIEKEKDEKYKKYIDKFNLYLLKSERYKHENKNKTENRPYVGYRCIYSGMMEYFFPIIHADKIVAVLMSGPYPAKDLDKDKMFKIYRDEKLDRWINKKFEEDKREKNSKRKLFHLPEDYNPIAEKHFNVISELINSIEEKIDNAVMTNSRYYVANAFFHIERSFRIVSRRRRSTYMNIGNKLEDLRNDIKDLDNDLIGYERLLSLALRSIVYRFNFNTDKEFIRIYALESSIANRVNPNKDVFNLIGDSSFVPASNPPSDNRKYKKIIFNKIENRDDTLNKEELLSNRIFDEPYFPERYWKKLDGFDLEKDNIRVEFSFSTQVAYLIWERYDSLDKNSKQYKEYYDYLNLMSHALLEPYIILEWMRLEKDLENTMRISSHESAQIIPDVIHTINIPKTIEALEVEKYSGPEEIKIPANNIIDASRRLLLLNNLSSRLSFIFKEQKPVLEKTDFHRIIYATESLYQRRAYLRNRQQIIVSYPTELNLYYLMTNYDYLSHILFNLIDNAIKYGLRGSNIHIKAWLNYTDRIVDNIHTVKTINDVVISITSYGAKIEDGDIENIFELYYRSAQAIGEGIGIGLFLVKKLCNLLKYEIECMPSEWIADYHLPVKYHYNKQNDKSFDAPHLGEVVNKAASNWKIDNEELDVLLPRPTYKNEFKITIPVTEYETLQKKY